ncbi:magnesium-transporting ATPase (P-type) [Anoxybacillus tepidamans]|uniref:Magnesium-transporting ATPase (P-type) n=1 Tax=Anoxybacteroides tepidamans TaxID=265948 RepID=A0A7W8IS10_9BACL|nr:hypothetical protein [Anoxybacillus tepidamans]MBB5324742.1 magnesium-transporting ATPase (P-type) [Anoxybacillus tepidamans]
MNEKRREIIVREIEYWKRSRLLPEQYCDYLLALYTEGEGSHSYFRSARFNWMKWIRLFFILLICLLLPATVLVIYFTELSFVLQMLLLSLFVIVCLMGVWMWRKAALVHLPLVSGAFLLFLASIRISDYYFPQMTAVSAFMILLNCLLWIAVGVRFRFLYLTISGFFGILLLGVSFFF